MWVLRWKMYHVIICPIVADIRVTDRQEGRLIDHRQPDGTKRERSPNSLITLTFYCVCNNNKQLITLITDIQTQEPVRKEHLETEYLQNIWKQNVYRTSEKRTASCNWSLFLISYRLLLLCRVTFPPLCSNVAKRDFCSSFRQALDLLSWTRMSHMSCICLCWESLQTGSAVSAPYRLQTSLQTISDDSNIRVWPESASLYRKRVRRRRERVRRRRAHVAVEKESASL